MAEIRKEVIIFGNWGLGLQCLQRFIPKVNIRCVVTQFDPESKDIYYNQVYYYAQEHGIRTYRNFRQLLSEEANLSTCLGVSVAYNEIFSPEFLDRLNVVNFHPSKLPDYRGPSPVEWQIKSGCSYIGLTGHWVDSSIDTGEIICQGQFPLDYTKGFNQTIDELNRYFADFISETVLSILQHTSPKDVDLLVNHKNPYYPRISLPKPLRNKSLSVVREYFNRRRISIFTGNRAEFGILFPLILELSQDYQIDLFVSGSHLLPPWNTVEEIKEKLDSYQVPVNLVLIRLDQVNNEYLLSLPTVYQKTIKFFLRYKKSMPYDLAIVLGDRIETFGFALAAFYANVPLIHISGGDVANVPYFDTNVRHSLTKLAHIHLTSNEKSGKVIEQLGEENWRIKTIGNLSYDYDRLGFLSKEELITELNLCEEDFVFICTYHASHQRNAQDNLRDFLIVYETLLAMEECKIIITYPNNDPGSEDLLWYLDEQKKSPPHKCRIVPNLGTIRYLSLMKFFNTVVIGNSSSGLMETSLYGVPTINIGDRQTDRFRGPNVIDLDLDPERLRSKIWEIRSDYTQIRANYMQDRFFFGDGTAAVKAKSIIDQLFHYNKEDLLLKQFKISSEYLQEEGRNH